VTAQLEHSLDEIKQRRRLSVRPADLLRAQANAQRSIQNHLSLRGSTTRPIRDIIAPRVLIWWRKIQNGGDRNIRDVDRQLFLEALLSARAKFFYLSYVGQSLRDNKPLPPSVLVSELLDYVAENFETPHRWSS